MDSELRCNRLVCRKLLADKAVVTTCSHIFCVECANELFNAARLCPACETSLSEPDDVVVCSLHPTNDYKTSVLSGLSPSIILEICSRAISFWQYQIHQENSFQLAVVRSVNDKNAQLQKQLDSVVREADGEISLLNTKNLELERDLELERRKTRELHDSSREKDKEYQKLKAQYDKLKHRLLLNSSGSVNTSGGEQLRGDPSVNRAAFGNSVSVDIDAIAGGMEASGRAPIAPRTTTGPFAPLWKNAQHAQHNVGPMRQQFTSKAQTASERSPGSAQEVEGLLATSAKGHRTNRRAPEWSAQTMRSNRRSFATTTTKREQGGFKPSSVHKDVAGWG